MTMLGQIEIRKQISGRLKQARESAGYKTAADFAEAVSYTHLTLPTNREV